MIFYVILLDLRNYLKMNTSLHVDEVIKDINFTSEGFHIGDFEACVFKRCTFRDLELGSSSFEDCEFVDCDLSNSKLSNTALRDVQFNNCKMLGLHFETCNPFLFSVQFTKCQLSVASFYQCILKQSQFRECLLKDVDFVEADLTKAVFSNCDLEGALFDHSILVETDFSSAFHYRLDPEVNTLKKTKFSKEGLHGLLGKYDIKISA